MTYLLDASAALAPLLAEPGTDQVVACADDAAITTVNLAELVTQLVRHGRSDLNIAEALAVLDLRVLLMDETDSRAAGLMVRDTSRSGLSLGDRCCLAVARRRGLIAVTADRAWAQVATDLEVEVQLIR